MKACALCKGQIQPASPAVELAGGLFDPDDPDFFVIDESVLVVSYAHRDCLLKQLKKTS
jgi:hypothetical protein